MFQSIGIKPLWINPEDEPKTLRIIPESYWVLPWLEHLDKRCHIRICIAWVAGFHFFKKKTQKIKSYEIL